MSQTRITRIPQYDPLPINEDSVPKVNVMLHWWKWKDKSDVNESSRYKLKYLLKKIKMDSVQSLNNYLQKLFTKNLLTAR